MSEKSIISHPGLVALMGSGETAAPGGKVFEALARRQKIPLRISILETPAGFELNSPQVAGRVGDYLKIRLQNYQPQIELIPARKKGTEFSPEKPEILRPMLRSDLLFMGPGSPSYTVRQLHNTLAWNWFQARHRLGASIALASAATVAMGVQAIPVYEIFKVGEDPHWKPGLDFLGSFGLSLIIVPHWNNNDGGNDVDTSHCFIGGKRFELLRSQLQPENIVLGLDEHTSLLIDFEQEICEVMGRDSIHILKAGKESSYVEGDRFSVKELGPFHLPEEPCADLPDESCEELEDEVEMANIPLEVQILIEQRQEARMAKDWGRSDQLRLAIAALGWKVLDTPSGPQAEEIE